MDLTGAVVASAVVIGPRAEEVAAIVKMAQESTLGIYCAADVVQALIVARRDLATEGQRPHLLQPFPKFVHVIRPLVPPFVLLVIVSLLLLVVVVVVVVVVVQLVPLLVLIDCLVLCCVVWCGVVLCCVVLCWAVLCGVLWFMCDDAVWCHAV